MNFSAGIRDTRRAVGVVSRQAATYVRADAAGRRAIRRWGAFKVLGGVTPVVAVDSELGRVFVSTADHVVGLQTFVTGGYELDGTRDILDLLDRCRPGWETAGTIVEIGANIGTTTLLLARRAEVLCFEPVPFNVALLRANVAANDLQDRVAVRAMALSDESGEVTMEIEPSNSGDNRVRRGESAFSDASDHPSVTVACSRLDDELDHDAVSLLWIDAQGHEPQVLAGATRVLKAGVPIVMEYWPHGLDSAGGLAALDEIIVANYTTVIDTSDGDRCHPADKDGLAALQARYTDQSAFTNVVLLR